MEDGDVLGRLIRCAGRRRTVGVFFGRWQDIAAGRGRRHRSRVPVPVIGGETEPEQRGDGGNRQGANRPADRTSTEIHDPA